MQIVDIQSCVCVALLFNFSKAMKPAKKFGLFALLLILTALPSRAAMAAIDMRNANFSHSWVLMNLDHLDFPRNLGQSISYSSRATRAGFFGRGWCSDLETRLRVNADTTIDLIQCGQGSETRFIPLGEDQAHLQQQLLARLMEKIRDTEKHQSATLAKFGIPYLLEGRDVVLLEQILKSRPDIVNQLAAELDVALHADATTFSNGTQKIQRIGQGYALRSPNGDVLQFDNSGVLSRVEDMFGNTARFAYHGNQLATVTSGSGHKIAFEWEGFVKAISVDTGEHAEFEYRKNSGSQFTELIRIKNAWNNSYTQHYDTNSNMTVGVWPTNETMHVIYDKKNDWTMGFIGRDRCNEFYTYWEQYTSPDTHQEFADVFWLCEGECRPTRHIEFDFAEGRLFRTSEGQDVEVINYAPDKPSSIKWPTEKMAFRHDQAGRIAYKHRVEAKGVVEEYFISYDDQSGSLKELRIDSGGVSEQFIFQAGKLPDTTEIWRNGVLLGEAMPAAAKDQGEVAFELSDGTTILGKHVRDAYNYRLEYFSVPGGKRHRVKWKGAVPELAVEEQGQPAPLDVIGQGNQEKLVTLFWAWNTYKMISTGFDVYTGLRRTANFLPSSPPKDTSPADLKNARFRFQKSLFAARQELRSHDQYADNYSKNMLMKAGKFELPAYVMLDSLVEWKGLIQTGDAEEQRAWLSAARVGALAALDLGNREQARKILETLLAYAESTGNTQAISEDCFRLAVLEFEDNRTDRSIELFERGIALYRGRGKIIADANFKYLASAYARKGRFTDAASEIRRIMGQPQSAPLSRDGADVMGYLAEIYVRLQMYDEALQLLKSAYFSYTLLGVTDSRIPNTLAELSHVLRLLGHADEAKGLFEHALKVAHEQNPTTEPAILINYVYDRAGAGDYPEAMRAIARADTLVMKLWGKNDLKADLLKAHSFLATRLGQNEQAMVNDYLVLLIESKRGVFTGTRKSFTASKPSRQAAPLNALIEESYKQYGERLAELNLVESDESFSGLTDSGLFDQNRLDTAINNVAVANFKAGKHELAESMQAILLQRQLSRIPDDRYRIAITRANLGRSQLALNKYKEGIAELEAAVTLFKSWPGTEPWRIINAQVELGRAHAAQNEMQAAIRIANEVLVLAQESGVPDFVWKAYALKGELHQRKQELSMAIFWGKRAVGAIEEVRKQLSVLDTEVQASYLHDKEKIYRWLADLCIQADRLPEAEEAIGLLKRSEFEDFQLRSERKITVGKNPAEADFEKRYLAVSAELGDIGTELGRLQRKRNLQALSQAEEKRLYVLSEKRLETISKFNRVLAGIIEDDRKLSVARSVTSSGKMLDRARGPLQNALQSLRKNGHEAVALQYLVLPDKVRILISTSGGQTAREIAVNSEELNRQVALFRTHLLSNDYLPYAEKLYDALIRPIEGDLEKFQGKALMLSLDGKLRMLPFAALHDSKRKQYLAQRYVLSVFNVFSLSHMNHQESQWRFAGFGASDFQKLKLDPLPNTREELQSIKLGEQGVMPGDYWFAQEFNQGNLVAQANSGNYTLLHIASHFSLQANSADSYLAMGDGTRLSLNELRKGIISFRKLGMVAFSACETGVDAGKEIESLGMQVHEQGVGSVLATLWKLSDTSTPKFMKRMYELIVTEKKSKAEAIQQTQVEFSQGKFGSKFQNPFYWAPFILIGNWL